MFTAMAGRRDAVRDFQECRGARWKVYSAFRKLPKGKWISLGATDAPARSGNIKRRVCIQDYATLVSCVQQVLAENRRPASRQVLATDGAG